MANEQSALQPLFSRPSPHLLNQQFEGNTFFITRDTADKAPEGPPFQFSRLVCDYDFISGHARHFPVLLKNGKRLQKDAEQTLFAALGEKPQTDQPVANLAAAARNYLTKLRIKNPDEPQAASLIWLHALAIGYSPAYLSENADGIRRDWPRIPLPADRKVLEASAALGEKIAALLDSETDVPGVTSGKIGAVFKTIALVTKTGGGAIDPSGDDLAVTAGWGHHGKAGVVMPAKGKTNQRPFDPAEMRAIEQEGGAAAKEARRLLGDKTLDIYLNDAAYWRNIPLGVWGYSIGGYQVIKKWLSYRELPILGRALTPEQVRQVTNMARRIAAIVLLQPKLDENYQQVKGAAYAWADEK